MQGFFFFFFFFFAIETAGDGMVRSGKPNGGSAQYKEEISWSRRVSPPSVAGASPQNSKSPPTWLGMDPSWNQYCSECQAVP